MSNHIVVYFECDNTFTIIEDTKNKFKNSNTAKVNFNNRWYNGSIVCSGSKKKCQNYADFELRKSKFIATDDSDAEPDELIQNVKTRFSSNLKLFLNILTLILIIPIDNSEAAFQKEIEKIRAFKRGKNASRDSSLETLPKKRVNNSSINNESSLEETSDDDDVSFHDSKNETSKIITNKITPNQIIEDSLKDPVESASTSNEAQSLSLSNNTSESNEIFDCKKMYIQQNEVFKIIILIFL